MNEYDKILKEDIRKIYGESQAVLKDYRNWARAQVNGKKSKLTKPEWNTAEENRLYTLSVVAELRRKYPEATTINYDLLPGAITLSEINVLRDEQLIDLFRVAHPYQIVFFF